MTRVRVVRSDATRPPDGLNGEPGNVDLALVGRPDKSQVCATCDTHSSLHTTHHRRVTHPLDNGPPAIGAYSVAPGMVRHVAHIDETQPGLSAQGYTSLQNTDRRGR